MKKVIFIPLFLASCLLSFSQKEIDLNALVDQAAEMAAGNTENAPTESILKPSAGPLEDSLVFKNYIESIRAYYDYKQQGYDHRRKSFDWQLLSSKIVFFAVLVLIGFGLYFSYMQFRRDADKEGVATTNTEMEASATGIKVSSPVLGVIILVLSMVFFYLYLVYVFPIEETF